MNRTGRHGVDYERIHLVLSQIEQQPDSCLGTESMAAAAGLSASHFHRCFSSLFGETPARYVRKRRLDMACDLLIARSHWSVLDVAVATGFQSAEAFARAFGAQYSMAPSVWRATQQQIGLHSRNCQDRVARETYRAVDELPIQDSHVQLVTRAAQRIAGLRYQGPYGAPLGEFMRTHFYPWCAAQGLHRRDVYGVSLDNPEIVPAAECRFDACVAVDVDDAIHGADFDAYLPAGCYAEYEFSGDVQQIGPVWRSFFGQWLTNSKYVFTGFSFEHYRPSCQRPEHHAAFDCTLCIGVSPA